MKLRLNVERLKSNRGIHTVENYCADIKYRGKGYEREDMNDLMKRLEHWAHRLYPNYKFDDFVPTVEKLGKKKELQTHMYRYRNDLLEEIAQQKKLNESDDERGDDQETSSYPIDELDEIIDQQIQNYSSVVPKTPSHDKTFDSIRSSMIASPRLSEQVPVEASTPIAPKFQPLTAEQMARIAENRRLAQEKLRKKRMEAEAAATVAAAAAASVDTDMTEV